METFRTLVGWLLFLAMAVVAGFFWHQSAERGAHIALLSNTIEQMESQINQLSENIDLLEEQTMTAMQTIAAMKDELQASQDIDLRLAPDVQRDGDTPGDTNEVVTPTQQENSLPAATDKKE